MPATLLSMSQNVANEVGYSGKITATATASGDAARIVRYVKEATVYIENLWGDWRFLWGGLVEGVATSGSNSIAAPVNLYRWDQERLFFDTHTVCPIMWNDFKMYSAMNDPGYPTQFVIMPDNSIRMFSPPDANYNYMFSWYKQSVPLVSDNDQPLIPDQFRKVIEARALWLYAMYDEAAELAAKADNEYALWLAQLEADQRPDGMFANQSNGNHVRISAE